MDLGIKGKLALVTGAGRGLGRSIALNLAKEGASVAVVSRSTADIDHLVEDMGGKSGGHFGVVMDLVADLAPQKLCQQLTDSFGYPDIVVHNVGGNLNISDPFCPIEDWRKIWRFNLEIAIELNTLLVPPMQKKKWGRVVHVSSISAMENQGAITYCTVKAALTSYARGLGRIVASDGVIVTSVLPGAIFTEKGYWDITKTERPEHYRAFLNERMAIKRFGEPDELGGVVTFLCSQHSSFMVGSTVPVDGGQGRTFYQW